MKVLTSVTVETKGAKGAAVSLPPGSHDLPEAIAKDLIANGFAVQEGKESAPAQASAGNGLPQPSILDGSVAEVVALLGAMDAAELDLLAAEETAGKARKGVLDAIAAAKEDLED